MAENVARSTFEMLQQATEWLKSAGIETPRNDAKLLLAEAFGVTAGDVEKSILLDTPLHSNIKDGSAAVDGVDVHRIDGDDDSGGMFGGDGETGDVNGGSANAGNKHKSNAANDIEDADGAAIRRFAVMIARRKQREPLQYIVGHAPFRYLDLEVGPGVFIPRPETETVVQVAIDWLTKENIKPSRLVDLCAGSGAIGLSLVTEVTGSEVWAVELSQEALEWTKRNEQKVFKDHSLAGYNYHLFHADAANAMTLQRLDGTIDAVVTNPPYVPLDQIPEQPEVRDYDPKTALYGGSADGTYTPERIILRAEKLLRNGGALVMEHDISQAQLLVDFARTHGFRSAHTGEDLTGRPRYLFAIKG
ncbi:peptide chain release factor N(5)-glutamine methyltransferase [Bifidobacterium sp. ESL0728]|uniref:peptide chain release factor N(5)-glutamine methyltransferase n=1 Tax=Bifidobacterium sp. ESL0728 TaxID=2983220 RepID=UPI0023F8DBF8|nr:peptide chain release factor N(5)-glutamine methyltransferase [Bifidobacterium sp. ESL0728]WEV59565.1 peptide chain release factor N(5)-glutamine methyltransferase [Bifidobacterium sp. ESL0728]